MLVTSQPEAKMPDAGQIELWRQAVRQTTFANYHLEMGLALVRAGEPERAAEQLETALTCWPKHHACRQRLIRILGASSPRGRELSAAGQQLDPNFARIGQISLAFSLLQQDRREEALAEADLALMIAPTDPHALLVHIPAAAGCGKVSAAQASLKALDAVDLSSVPVDMRECFEISGNGLINHGKLAEARIVLLSLHKLTSGNADILKMLPFLCQATGHLQEAIGLFQDRLRSSPDDANLLTDIGQTCLAVGDIASALTYCQQAVAVTEDDPVRRALNSLALVQLAAGHLQAANQTLKWTGITSHNASGWVAEQFFSATILGLIRLQEGNLPPAETALRAAHALAPSDDWAASCLGAFYQRAGRRQEAARLFRDIARRRPEWAAFLARLRPGILPELRAGFAAEGVNLDWT